MSSNFGPFNPDCGLAEVMLESLRTCANRHKLRSPWSELNCYLLLKIIRKLKTVYLCIKTDCYVYDHVNHILLDYLIYCSWDTDLNKSVDFLLDPFCIYTTGNICCCTEYLKSRLICKICPVLFLFPHRT